MSKLKKQDADILSTKKKELDIYVGRFTKTVNMITTAVESLEEINGNINDKIAEIDDYVNELNITRQSLGEAKSKNDKVIKNFKALLS